MPNFTISSPLVTVSRQSSPNANCTKAAAHTRIAGMPLLLKKAAVVPDKGSDLGLPELPHQTVFKKIVSMSKTAHSFLASNCEAMGYVA